jgi:hypothetical protein
MKRILVLLFVISTSFTLRADLVMQHQIVGSDWTNDITTKIHGNKMRSDGTGKSSRICQIVDLVTHDSCMVMPEQKSVKKTSSEQVAKVMEQHGFPPGKDFIPPKPVDTGKTEVVGGLKTKIYNWSFEKSAGREIRQTLWVAEDFPNHEAIRIELLKLDHFHNSGLDWGMQPDFSPLPGMVVKSQTIQSGKSWTTTLVSAKAEPVDSSVFEVLSDYTEWKPPVFHPQATTNSIK